MALSLCWALSAAVVFAQPEGDWQTQVREQVAKKDLSAALQVTERRLEEAPKDFEARGWRARLLHWMGRRSEAEKEYRTVLESFPQDTDILQGLADVLMAEQRNDEALALLDRARELLPNSAEVLVRRGRALRAMGRIGEARTAFREALALEPGNREAKAGLDAATEGPRHELRFGADIDKFNYTEHARAFTVSLRSELHPRWTSNISGIFYHRFGQEAGRFGAALTYRLTRRDAITLGGAAARDQGVIPKGEAMFEYGHGESFGQRGFFRGIEMSYGQRWLWYEAARILTASPSALIYLPRDWTWQVTLVMARSRFPGTGAEWRPNGSTRLTFPVHRRVSANIFYAVGTENFARTDQIGRFSARTFGGGVRIAVAQRQEITAYSAFQDRSQGRTQTSAGFSYAIRF